LIVGPYRSNELLSDHQLRRLVQVSCRVKGGMEGKVKEGVSWVLAIWHAVQM
jgi:hypothetical protein